MEKILATGFSLLSASIIALIIVLYVKLSNIEDILGKKFKQEDV